MSSDELLDDLAGTEIAIVGMAGRFPGARDVGEFWTNIRDGVEALTHVGDDELREVGVSDATLRNPNYVKAGCYLEEYDQFDAGFFQFSPMDAAIMDPQHRVFLEVSWQAIESAGYTPSGFQSGGDEPRTIGVFGGSGMNAYLPYNLLTNPQLLETVGFFLLRHTGNDKDFLTTRVSYCLDLHGPSINVQTACSTSLVAIHLAVQSLLGGECDMALAGACTIELPHRRGYMYQEGEILSPDGHCRAFDADSKGTIFGSGCGVVALRRLEDAIADGDHIHAVVKGSAINNDGSMKVGYLAPSVDGQAQAIAEALSLAEVDAESVSYIETHGTGTPVGDPIEIEAMTTAHRSQTDASGYCAIGSVKTNIGHLDTAAGIAGVIKVAAALENEQIPPSLNYHRPNPQIDFEKTPFFVNARLRDWPRTDQPRRAGVSSLGVGGTNAHIVLEEAPLLDPSSPSREHQLLVLSARSKAALENATENLARHLEQEKPCLADVAYTLQSGRESFAVRRSVVAKDIEDAVEALRSPKRYKTRGPISGKPSTVFMFPGGGAPYPTMGADLYEKEPVYRREVDRCLEILSGDIDFDLKTLLYPTPEQLDDAKKQIARPAIQLPALFVTEYAVAQLLMSWGIHPAAMIGHSMGENTAACLAGTLSLEDGLRLVTLRGRLFEKVKGGGMLSVDLAREELEPMLPAELSIAAVNAPGLCVASGPVAALDDLEKTLQSQDIECRRIKIDIAAHSPMLEPILDEFRQLLMTLDLREPKIPFVSNVSGTWITKDEAMDPEYWVRHLRSTVSFCEGIATLDESDDRLMIEVGPGNTLGTLARMCKPGPDRLVFTSLRHRDETVDDQAFLLDLVGQAWDAGLDVEWKALFGEERRLRLPLPTYPFEHQRYWIEPGKQQFQQEQSLPALERTPDLTDWLYQPTWKPASFRGGDDVSEEPLTWLVFMDATGLGEQLVDQLESGGHRVVTVREGDAFYSFKDNEFAVSPESRGSYEALVGALGERDLLPDRIAHLWLVTDKEVFRPGSSFFHRNMERGFYSLVYLVQAFGYDHLQAGASVTVFSSGMQRVDGEALPYPEKSLALGPVLVIPHEYPGVTTQSVDVDLSFLDGRALPLDVIIEEMIAGSEDRQIAYRDGRRWKLEFRQGQLATPGDRSELLQDGGVYLITGGLGGIGLTMAEYLSQNYQAKLVLVGRTELPSRDEWTTWLDEQGPRNAVSRRIHAIQRLEEHGAEVQAVVGDVANIEDMGRIIDGSVNRFGKLNGIIHAAGIIADGVLQEKSHGDCERVFTPKVHGTNLLAELTREQDLDFLLLFSSTSTVLGPAGQVDYVAANQYLNAFAHARDQDQKRVIALNWGIWQQVGMAAELGLGAAGTDSPQHGDRPVGHPFLGHCSDGQDGGVTFTTEYGPASHWMLDQHRTGDGQAVVPGTGFLEIARAAFAECRPKTPVLLEDVLFLSPLSVDDGSHRTVRVELEDEGESMTFTISSSDNGDNWQTHCQGTAASCELAAPGSEAISLANIKKRLDGEEWSDPDGYRTPQEAHLRFGARWRNLVWARFGHGEALARLELPAQYVGELSTYALHPALLDLATGFAMPLIEGYEGDALYVPLTYKRVSVHRPLEATIHSHVRCHEGSHVDKETVTFDITLADTHGSVLVEVSGFTIKKLGENTVFGAPPPSSVNMSLLSPEERMFQDMLAMGIMPGDGGQALDRVLDRSATPQMIVSSMGLDTLMAITSATVQASEADDGARFARPELESNYVEPRTGVEHTLVSMWEELLGVDQVGVQDSFFELGGYSLLAVRLFARIKKVFGVDYAISILFEAPTIEELAALIQEEVGDDTESEEGADAPKRRRRKFDHLVQLQKGEATRAPFFLVAGMFGNIMNLRHLVAHIGDGQPYYAVQARGLLGDEIPYTSFEEMAEAYLREIREVQPEGPYYLGGFSGGGVTAYEMAQQLRSVGEEVAMLIMLDTPAPDQPRQLYFADKLSLHWQDMVRTRGGHVMDFVRRRLGGGQAEQEEASEDNVAEYRSGLVGEAFLEALRVYHTQQYPGEVHLFRPEPQVHYRLSGGRRLTHDRTFIDDHNFWGPHVTGSIHLHMVPGDHDSMVLEPNVRVLGRVIADLIGRSTKELQAASESPKAALK